MNERVIERFIKEGASIFNPKDIAFFKIIKEKYAEDYLKYLDEIGKYYMQSGAMGRLIIDTRSAAKSIGNTIDILLGNGTRLPTEDDLSSLFDNVAFVDKSFSAILTKVESTKTLRSRTEAIRQRTGLDVDQLKQSSTTIKKRMQSIGKKPSAFQQAVGIGRAVAADAPEAMGIAKELGGGLSQAFLGPFSEIGGLAMRSVTGIAKGLRARKAAKEEQQIAKKIMPSLNITPELARSFQAFQRPEQEDIRSAIGDLQGSQRISPTTGQPVRPYTRREPTKTGVMANTMSALGIGQGKSESIGLKQFFDRDAFRSKWTNEVIKHLRIMSKSAVSGKYGAGSKDTGFLSSVLGAGTGVGLATSLKSKIGKAAIGAGGLAMKSLPFVGGAMGIWDIIKGMTSKTGQLLGKGNGDKTTLSDRIFGGIGALLGGTNKGIGEKGASVGGVLRGMAGGALKGAALGSVVPFLGTGVGAAIGGIGGAIGGGRIARGAKTLFEQSQIGRVATAYQRAGDIYGTKEPTFAQKVGATSGAILSRSTFGLVDEKRAALGMTKLGDAITNRFNLIVDKFKKKNGVISANGDVIPNGVKAIRNTSDSIPITVDRSSADMRSDLQKMTDTISNAMKELTKAFKESTTPRTVATGANESIFITVDPDLNKLNRG